MEDRESLVEAEIRKISRKINRILNSLARLDFDSSYPIEDIIVKGNQIILDFSSRIRSLESKVFIEGDKKLIKAMDSQLACVYRGFSELQKKIQQLERKQVQLNQPEAEESVYDSLPDYNDNKNALGNFLERLARLTDNGDVVAVMQLGIFSQKNALEKCANGKNNPFKEFDLRDAAQHYLMAFNYAIKQGNVGYANIAIDALSNLGRNSNGDVDNNITPNIGNIPKLM